MRRGAEESAGPALDPPTIAERIAELRRLEAEDPKGLWFLPLGGALRDGGRLLEAVQVIRRGLAREAESLSGWVVLGQCYLALDELRAARRVLESALRRDPENALALRCLAILHARQGRRTAAATCYRTLLKLVPSDLAAQEALATLLEPAEDEAGAASLEPVLPPRIRGETPGAVPRGHAAERSPARRRLNRYDPSSRRPEVSRPRRGSASVLPPEPRPDAGIFEPPPHDLDWERPVPDRSAGKARRPAATRTAPTRRAKAPTAGAPRREAGTPEPSSRDHKSSPAVSSPAGARAAGRSSALSGYRRWLERLMHEEGRAGTTGSMPRPKPEDDRTAEGLDEAPPRDG